MQQDASKLLSTHKGKRAANAGTPLLPVQAAPHKHTRHTMIEHVACMGHGLQQYECMFVHCVPRAICCAEADTGHPHITHMQRLM